MNQSDLLDIFERIKSKIGKPRTYELTKEEQQEIARIKKEIAMKEAAEKAEDDQRKEAERMELQEKQLQEWVSKEDKS